MRKTESAQACSAHLVLPQPTGLAICRSFVIRRSCFVSGFVTSVNRADGNSEIEGKAAKGSGERVGKRSEFQIRGRKNPRNSRFRRFKKTLKKVKKKLVSPRRVPLNGDLTRQVRPEDRSKKL